MTLFEKIVLGSDFEESSSSSEAVLMAQFKQREQRRISDNTAGWLCETAFKWCDSLPPRPPIPPTPQVFPLTGRGDCPIFPGGWMFWHCFRCCTLTFSEKRYRHIRNPPPAPASADAVIGWFVEAVALRLTDLWHVLTDGLIPILLTKMTRMTIPGNDSHVVQQHKTHPAKKSKMPNMATEYIYCYEG